MFEKGLYKYVIRDSGEIIYIGKSDSSIKQRIQKHNQCDGIDYKFKDYIEKCDIYVTEIKNPIETEILEKALIDKYKPILNVMDKHPEISKYFRISEPEWIKLPGPFTVNKNKRNLEEKILKRECKLFYAKRIRFYPQIQRIPNDLSGDITVSNLIHNEFGDLQIFNSDEDAIEFLKNLTKECLKNDKDFYGDYFVYGRELLYKGVPSVLYYDNDKGHCIQFLNLKIAGFHILPIVKDVTGEGPFAHRLFICNYLAIELLKQGFHINEKEELKV